MYVVTIYFTVTTIATVGYGDISAMTTSERIYVVILMLSGVSAFTFLSGALSSIIQSYDVHQADL